MVGLRPLVHILLFFGKFYIMSYSSDLRSLDLPDAHGGKVSANHNNDENDLFFDVNDSQNDFNINQNNEHLLPQSTAFNDLEDNNDLSESFAKPSIIEWLSIYEKLPDDRVNQLFDSFNFDKENEEISWLRVYDKLSIDELNKIISSTKDVRAVEIDLDNESSEEDIGFGLFDNPKTYSKNDKNNEKTVKFATINRSLGLRQSHNTRAAPNVSHSFHCKTSDIITTGIDRISKNTLISRNMCSDSLNAGVSGGSTTAMTGTGTSAFGIDSDLKCSPIYM